MLSVQFGGRVVQAGAQFTAHDTYVDLEIYRCEVSFTPIGRISWIADRSLRSCDRLLCHRYLLLQPWHYVYRLTI